MAAHAISEHVGLAKSLVPHGAKLTTAKTINGQPLRL